MIHRWNKMSFNPADGLTERSIIWWAQTENKKMWDEVRIFTTNKELNDGVKAPQVNREIVLKTEVGGDKLNIIKND